MFEIRPERPGDEAAIADVNRRAFEGEEEVRIIDGIRDSEYFIPELSLVAESEGRIVGHILFSIITLVRFDRPAEKILSLAPMAVDPEMQNRGVRSALVQAGMDKARELGHTFVIVIGHPGYYPKHGFSPAGAQGLEAPYPIPPKDSDAWMVQDLHSGAIENASGEVTCAEALMDPKHWRE